MGEFDVARLIYLSLLGGAVVLWFFAQNRNSLGKTTQQAMVWGLIFVGVIAGVGLWDDIRDEVMPGAYTVTGENQIELPRAGDGHYYVTAEINGAEVDFVVDTGATMIVLTQADAEKAGFKRDDLAFVGRAGTANGEVRTAPVWLDNLRIGPIEDFGVGAMVNGGELDQSLLGMSYLQKFHSVEIRQGKLILTR